MQSSSTRGVAIVLGIVVVLGIVWAFNHRKVGDADVPVGPVTGLTLVAEAREPVGEVTLVRSGEEMPVTHQMTLTENDIVRTGQAGGVSLEFFAGSRVALDRDTEVRVDTASVNRINQRDQRVQITLLGGRLWSRVLRLLEVDAEFIAHTTDLSATVRGTAFAMTLHPEATGSARRVDLFDGQLQIGLQQRDIQGTLEAGFTFTDDADFSPTPDDTRNDPWIHAQLRADAAFVERVSATRHELGDRAPYEGVGDEAGPFTLDQAGVEHSNYQSLEIRMEQPLSVLQANQSIAMNAIAHFYEEGTTRQNDVTPQATWHLSDTSLATLTPNGILTAKEGVGIVIVAARWNDGSHEHSHAIAIPIGEFMADFSPPVITLPSR